MNGFEKRTEIKKKQILDATFEMMNSNQGITNVRIDEIAKIAQVGKTTIFKYFGSKEKLIYEVFYTFLNSLKEATQAIMDEHKSFEEKLMAMILNKINYLQSVNQQFYLDLMEFFTSKDLCGNTLLMKEYEQMSTSIMLDLFHQGKKEGKIDLKYSDEFILIYFQAMVEGISSAHIYEQIVPYTKQWAEVLIHGLSKQEKKF